MAGLHYCVLSTPLYPLRVWNRSGSFPKLYVWPGRLGGWFWFGFKTCLQDAKWKCFRTCLVLFIDFWSLVSKIWTVVFKVYQNHRMAEVGRDLWRWFSPTPLCLKQGHLEQVAQNCVLLGFEHLQEWRIHNLSEQPAALELLVQSNCTNSVGYMEGDWLISFWLSFILATPS